MQSKQQTSSLAVLQSSIDVFSEPTGGRGSSLPTDLITTGSFRSSSEHSTPLDHGATLLQPNTEDESTKQLVCDADCDKST
eukprot:IDg17337t1